MEKISVQGAWNNLFDKYNIIDNVKEKGKYYITANEIKQFKEPRLMAKWDSSENLPAIFKSNKINILPVSRSEYVLGHFDLYEEIPELGENITEMEKVSIPEFETINKNNISSEANAINVLLISGILDDFLNAKDNYVNTFNGRMGTGEFAFNVNTHFGKSVEVKVKNAQCEIDAGLENSDSIVILEAKNVVHPDFHVRQLFYPYKLWLNKVTKPIKLVFSIYSNQIFRLFEYTFEDANNYSSIKLVKTKNYSIEDTEINNQEIFSIYKNTKVLYSDNQKCTEVPFIQADRFERVISLMEILYQGEKTKYEIAEIMEFDVRQSDYYFNAGRYLGLFEKKEVIEDSKKMKKIFLTKLATDLINASYKARQLKLVNLILQHQIFNDLFNEVFNEGKLPSKHRVTMLMRKYNVCEEGQVERRAGSVVGWIKWIFNLTKIWNNIFLIFER